MKLFLRSTLGALAALTVTAGKASADCLLGLCLPIGGGGGGPAPAPSAPGAPEIDVTQGAAAVAILLCALLILRERFMRQRA